MKTFRSTGIFASIVVALALISYFVVYRGAQKKAEQKAKAAVLFPFNATTVTDVDILSNGKEIHIQKTQKGWEILSPIHYLASTAAVVAFVNDMLTQRSVEKVPTGKTVSWNIYGLDKPAGSIAVTSVDKNGKKNVVKVLLGSRKAFANQMYLRFDGENKLYLVNPAWSTYLAKDVSSLRMKKVFLTPVTDVQEIHLQSEKNHRLAKLDFTQSKNKKWQLNNDPKFKLDQPSVTKFLQNISDLQALNFVSEDKTNAQDRKKYGLDRQPVETIDLALSGAKNTSGSEWNVKIYRQAAAPVPGAKTKSKMPPNYYMTVSGLQPIMQVSDFSAKALLLGENDFRDKTAPFQFKIGEVFGLRYHSPLFKSYLVKSAGRWAFKTSVKGKRIVQAKVNDLLSALKSLKVAKFMGHEHGKGLYPAKSEITLYGKDNKVIFQIAWGDQFKVKQADGTSTQLRYVRTNIAHQTLGVQTSQIDALPGQTLVENAPVASAKPGSAEQKKTSNHARTSKMTPKSQAGHQGAAGKGLG